MRSLKFAVLAFAFAALALPAVVRGQDNVEKVTFDTSDQVKLQGLYYPSTKLKKAPVVLMLHKIGGNITQDGWDKLALELQKAGYAVLIFDFRGHGNSTTVGADFWKDPINQKNVVGGTASKPKETISFKDYGSAYYPQLVNDITAAKVYLDKRNDGGDCNTSSMILIGAEDGAALGMMWLFSEQFRYRATVDKIFGTYVKDPTAEGTEIAAAIWLSISPKIGNVGTPMKAWTRYVGATKNVPMAFIYGEKAADADISKALLLEAKDKADKNKWTGEHVVKGTDLKGHGLLSDKVDARSWIVDNYLKKLFDDRAAPPWQSKEVRKSAYVWEFPRQGPIFFKGADEDSHRRAPTELLFQAPVP